ncbi:MAG TPA: LLM class flavin-dependent oxidoreductase, partial [Actinomycetota bacterium]|nr:LLM class flavin-dependent oxidoreductase [Actinomycetota bacterium]
RMEMLEEQVEIVHRLWDREQPQTFAGKHYRLDGVRALPKPAQEPHPPLIIGGRGGPRSARVAARWGDEYNVNGRTPEACRTVRAGLDRACQALDRDPASLRYSLMTQVVAGADRRELEARAKRVMTVFGEPGDPSAYLANAAETGVVGTVNQVLDRLAAYEEAGVERIMLQHLDHADLEMVALIGAEIIPQVA